MDTTKGDKIRQLTVQQLNAIEYLLQGMGDRETANTIGASRSTIWEWRHDILFRTELNRQRSELWAEGRERLRTLTNKALDVVAKQLESEDEKIARAAASTILKGTLFAEPSLSPIGPTSPEAMLLPRLLTEAETELKAKCKCVDVFTGAPITPIDKAEIEALARRKMEKILKEQGLA